MDIASAPCAAPPGPCALQQHPFYGRALADSSAQVVSLHAREAGQVLASAQILQRRLGPLLTCYLPRGPVWAEGMDDPVRARILREMLRSLPRALWLAAPESSADTAIFRSVGFRALMTPQYTAEFDLTRPVARMLADQHANGAIDCAAPNPAGSRSCRDGSIRCVTSRCCSRRLLSAARAAMPPCRQALCWPGRAARQAPRGCFSPVAVAKTSPSCYSFCTRRSRPIRSAGPGLKGAASRRIISCSGKRRTGSRRVVIPGLIWGWSIHLARPALPGSRSAAVRNPALSALPCCG